MSIIYRLLAATAHALEPLLASAWRWGTTVTARDETALSDQRSCLVVAPHPDDETIGCGATIARKRAAGTRVDVIIVADGRYAQRSSRLISPEDLATIRSGEAIAACAALGVNADHVMQLGYEDTHVDDHESQLVAELHHQLLRCQPEEVLVVSGFDHHPDHRAVNRAALAAIDRWSGTAEVREFAVWSWIDGPWLDQRDRGAFGKLVHLFAQPIRALTRGRAVSVSTGSFATTKQAALAAHTSQMSAYTDEAEWAVMDASLLAPFAPSVEIFLPVTPARSRKRAC